MRTLIQPLPSTHCGHCGGELRLKLVESAKPILDLEEQIFVCVNCGSELSRTVARDKYAPKNLPSDLIRAQVEPSQRACPADHRELGKSLVAELVRVRKRVESG